VKISNRRPFVYSNKFELQMFELRTEFERLFLEQQDRALAKRTAQQYITKPKHR
tara:strand:- start:2039 stop:2200 length:162 start_codon:yes stop_codon:yes gene_type:complete